MKRTFAILFIAGICLAVASLTVSRRKAAERAAQETWQKMKAQREAELKAFSSQAQAMATSPIFKQTLPAVAPAAKSPPATAAKDVQKSKEPAPASTEAPAVQVAKATPAVVRPSGKKGEIKDPLAREALSFVGFDSQAEAIWAEAINNPDLPPEERKDLIEDLNEDGFPDPKNITLDDLPLILSRLALIEDHAGDAMDEANWDAFMEAYKDLVKMYARLADF
jgi:hypothetical protein